MNVYMVQQTGRWGETVKDKVLVAAMVGRITHKAHLVNMSGQSHTFQLLDGTLFDYYIQQGEDVHKCPGCIYILPLPLINISYTLPAYCCPMGNGMFFSSSLIFFLENISTFSIAII